MKNNGAFGTITFMCIMLVIVIAALQMNPINARAKKYDQWLRHDVNMRSLDEIDSLSTAAQQDSVLWSAFLECSKNGGDAVCDSCFTAIYGYSLEYTWIDKR